MRLLRLWLFLVAAAACGPNQAQPGKASTTAGTETGSVGRVDSAFPIKEALKRFREGVPQPGSLTGGFDSRERLVRGFVRALEAHDTLALGRMMLGVAEFAWFYYPSSPLSRRPYELAPGLMWFQLQGESNRGASLLLAERAGRPFRYLGHTCGEARAEGENRLYPYCGIRRVTEARDTVTERLFGLVIERGGQYKFVSYANKL